MSINIGPAEAKICDGGISFVKHPITTNSSISSASLPDFLQLYAHIFQGNAVLEKDFVIYTTQNPHCRGLFIRKITDTSFEMVLLAQHHF
jgi:hypothetical protein